MIGQSHLLSIGRQSACHVASTPKGSFALRRDEGLELEVQVSSLPCLPNSTKGQFGDSCQMEHRTPFTIQVQLIEILVYSDTDRNWMGKMEICGVVRCERPAGIAASDAKT